MFVLAKIAFRNILKNRKRAFLIGIPIFISCTLYLVASSTVNAAEAQILKGYVNYQAGHVVVFWQSVKDISPDDPSRLWNSWFDMKRDTDNRASLSALDAFLEENRDAVAFSFSSMMRWALVWNGDRNFRGEVYGLRPENLDFLLQTNTLKLEEGVLDADDRSGVCISRLRADEWGLSVGDEVALDVTTASGAKNRIDYRVAGIYANGAPWEGYFVFMSEEEAEALFDVDAGYFDTMRVFLRDPDQAGDFARRLDDALLARSDVLRAESYREASVLFFTLGSFQRVFAAVFTVFFLAVIGMGIRSTMRMSLFERMREFGTLRAVGYSRPRVFLIIFFEVFFLAFFWLSAAVLAGIAFAAVFGSVGMHIGTGPLSYNFGGEYVYPFLLPGDILVGACGVLALSLLSILKPGLQLCFQRISEILLKRSRRIFVIPLLLKKLIAALGK